jgi:hypothetical protein
MGSIPWFVCFFDLEGERRKNSCSMLNTRRNVCPFSRSYESSSFSVMKTPFENGMGALAAPLPSQMIPWGPLAKKLQKCNVFHLKCVLKKHTKYWEGHRRLFSGRHFHALSAPSGFPV